MSQTSPSVIDLYPTQDNRYLSNEDMLRESFSPSQSDYEDPTTSNSVSSMNVPAGTPQHAAQSGGGFRKSPSKFQSFAAKYLPAAFLIFVLVALGVLLVGKAPDSLYSDDGILLGSPNLNSAHCLATLVPRVYKRDNSEKNIENKLIMTGLILVSIPIPSFGVLMADRVSQCRFGGEAPPSTGVQNDSLFMWMAGISFIMAMLYLRVFILWNEYGYFKAAFSISSWLLALHWVLILAPLVLFVWLYFKFMGLMLEAE